MTNCSPHSFGFSPLNRKKIEASFTGGSISSDGGLLLLREIDKRLGLIKKFSEVIQDDRHPSYVDHSVEHLLRQRVYAIVAGYEDVNDHDSLRQDSLFQVAVGRNVKLASGSTLSRFENSLDRASLVKLSQRLVEQFIDSHERAPKEVILDFDPTDHALHGGQENRHYHGYYQHHCFLPLHVFCGDHLLVSLLRPSNLDGAKYAGAILRLLVKRLRQAWSGVRIIFRGDCAFARKRILYWCEQNQVDYVVGIGSNQRLQKLAQSLLGKAQLQYEHTQTKQRLFGSYAYCADSWSASRRVIAKVEHQAKGSNTRFVLTTMTASAQTIYDQGYCPRGNMENGIKQLKLDMFSDRNSCSRFLANQFRLLLSSIAYTLVHAFQCAYLTETQFRKVYCRTLRLKLFKIGAVVLKNTRRIQIFFSSAYPYQDEFTKIVHQLVPI